MKIIFFDGVCNLCNSFVDFLLKFKLPPNFKVSSLQGEAAKEYLPQKDWEILHSVVYWREGEIYRESEAVIRALGDIFRPFKVFFVFLLLPSSLRDSLYRVIAKNRYRLFGKKETCRLPSPEERAVFLD